MTVILGLILGIITAINGNLDLTQNWLIIAYVLYVAIMALGIGYWTPRSKKVLAAAEASPDDQMSPELASSWKSRARRSSPSTCCCGSGSSS